MERCKKREQQQQQQKVTFLRKSRHSNRREDRDKTLTLLMPNSSAIFPSHDFVGLVFLLTSLPHLDKEKRELFDLDLK
jgi:hypothetical protein